MATQLQDIIALITLLNKALAPTPEQRARMAEKAERQRAEQRAKQAARLDALRTKATETRELLEDIKAELRDAIASGDKAEAQELQREYAHACTAMGTLIVEAKNLAKELGV